MCLWVEEGGVNCFVYVELFDCSLLKLFINIFKKSVVYANHEKYHMITL